MTQPSQVSCASQAHTKSPLGAVYTSRASPDNQADLFDCDLNSSLKLSSNKL